MVDFGREVFCLLGLPFDAVDMAGTLDRIREAAAAGRRCFVSTPNVNWVVSCRDDEAFRDSAIHSDLCVADGMPLVWVARLLDIPIRERIAGSTLFELLRRDTARPLSVYFFGGAKGVAEAACQRLRMEAEGLRCAGGESPGFGSVEAMSSDEVIDRINASRADFLVVALGAKKGQAWIERNRARLSTPLISHLGAVLNFMAGTVKRAPSWVGNAGFEWLWRIKEEPALWARYFRDGQALLALLATRVLPYAWYLRKHKPTAGSLAATRIEAWDTEQEHVIQLAGTWTQANLGPLREGFAKAARSQKDIRLVVSDVGHIDSAFVGLVALLQGHQKEQRRAFRLVGVSDGVDRILRYCCAEYLLAQPLPSLDRRNTTMTASRAREKTR